MNTQPNSPTATERLTRLKNKVDVMHQGIVVLMQLVRDGFRVTQGRLDGIDGRLDALTDIANRIYEEHGRRLDDIEGRLARNTRA